MQTLHKHNDNNDNGIPEALYGLGEYCNGFLNYRDTPIRCVQFNTPTGIIYFYQIKIMVFCGTIMVYHCGINNQD